MDSAEIISRRLQNHHLAEPDFELPEEVVAHFGAVQCQDFAAAKWGVGLRMRQASDASVEAAFNEGRILRTHLMRPTWHFVMPEDIRWMLELTAPQVKRILAPYDVRLGIDPPLLARCRQIFIDALAGGRFLSRKELEALLAARGVTARGQLLAHILMHAELDGLICSGPRQGKQLTYALLEERAPKAGRLSREASLSRLALKYFHSHGPAQIADFAWWSGLSVRDAREGLEAIRRDLEVAEVDGKTYYCRPETRVRLTAADSALLLSIYDEYTIAYRDRSAISERRDIERMISMGNALTAVVVLGGRVAGTWKRVVAGKQIDVSVAPFRDLTGAEKEALRLEVERYGRFLGLAASVSGL